jgi:hypothetical protein
MAKTDDVRSYLRRADALLREERYGEAVRLYEQAAESFTREGFLPKSIAVSKQIISIIDRGAPEMADVRERTLRRLNHAYTGLGLTAEAAEIRRLLG